jgi:ATP-dependent DNA helicase
MQENAIYLDDDDNENSSSIHNDPSSTSTSDSEASSSEFRPSLEKARKDKQEVLKKRPPAESLILLSSILQRAGLYSDWLAEKLVRKQTAVAVNEKLEFVTTTRQPSLITGCTMRDYQLVGLEWLIGLYQQGLNGILADEMVLISIYRQGLGKTLQTIAFIAHLYEKDITGPFLIIAPLSTLSNWVAEFKRFAPSINVLLYHGSPEEREFMRLQLDIDEGFPVIITSYEVCIALSYVRKITMNDRKHLAVHPWKFLIIDEGHRIKNLNCKLIKELKSYKSANRILLTGTP